MASLSAVNLQNKLQDKKRHKQIFGSRKLVSAKNLFL